MIYAGCDIGSKIRKPSTINDMPYSNLDGVHIELMKLVDTAQEVATVGVSAHRLFCNSTYYQGGHYE